MQSTKEHSFFAKRQRATTSFLHPFNLCSFLVVWNTFMCNGHALRKVNYIGIRCILLQFFFMVYEVYMAKKMFFSVQFKNCGNKKSIDSLSRWIFTKNPFIKCILVSPSIVVINIMCFACALKVVSVAVWYIISS